MTCSHPSVEAVGEPRIRLCFFFQPLTVARVMIQRVQESSQYRIMAQPLSEISAKLMCFNNSPAEPVHSIADHLLPREVWESSTLWANQNPFRFAPTAVLPACVLIPHIVRDSLFITVLHRSCVVPILLFEVRREATIWAFQSHESNLFSKNANN